MQMQMAFVLFDADIVEGHLVQDRFAPKWKRWFHTVTLLLPSRRATSMQKVLTRTARRPHRQLQLVEVEVAVDVHLRLVDRRVNVP